MTPHTHTHTCRTVKSEQGKNFLKVVSAHRPRQNKHNQKPQSQARFSHECLCVSVCGCGAGGKTPEEDISPAFPLHKSASQLYYSTGRAFFAVALFTATKAT